MPLQESREWERRICSSPIWYKEPGGENFRQGWMLEKSEMGAAFLSRGETSILPGLRLMVSTMDPLDTISSMREARVIRVEHVHGDVVLAGIQMKAVPGEQAHQAAAAEEPALM
jgi:hypothetical protein